MKKTVRICDVCGDPIPWFANRYKFKYFKHFRHSGEECCSVDMCSLCYKNFISFVIKQRSDYNAE